MKYLLVVVTWFAVLGINVYIFATEQGFNYWLVALLVILSIIPFAGKLKIGDWFDFRHKGSKESEETPLNKFTNIGNMNIQIQSEEAARAFADIMVTKTTISLPQGDLLTEKSKADITFMYNADQALKSLTALLRLLYVSMAASKKGLKIQDWKTNFIHELSSLYVIDLPSLIEQLYDIMPTISIMKSQVSTFKELLEPVKTLIKLRQLMDNNQDTPLPPIEEQKRLVASADRAKDYISGGLSVALISFYNSLD